MQFMFWDELRTLILKQTLQKYIYIYTERKRERDRELSIRNPNFGNLILMQKEKVREGLVRKAKP